MRIPRTILPAFVLGWALGTGAPLRSQETPAGAPEGSSPAANEAGAADTVPADAAPAESAPADTTPVESVPIDTAPVEDPPAPEESPREPDPSVPAEPVTPVERIEAETQVPAPSEPVPVPSDPETPAAAGAQAAAEGASTVELPVPTSPGGKEGPPPAESPTSEAPGPRSARKPGIGGGLKNVLNMLGGEESGPSTTEQIDKGANEETQKKVNELVRLANTSIEKGRVSEAMRNVNELITLKPYEADFHFALGLCYRREGKYKEALKKYQDVLDLGGPKALVALLKAEAFAAERDKEKAFEFLKEAAVGGRNIVNDVKTLPLLSTYQSDTEFIKLALQLEKFEVSAGKIHDPFTNPFPRPDAQEAAGDEAQGVVTLSPEEQEKLLHDAKKTYERVQFYIKLEDETKAMKAYASLREIMKKKDLLTIPKIVNDFRVLVARLEDVEVQIEGIRLKYYYNQAQVKLNQIKEIFADGEYQKIEPIHNEISKLTKEMGQTNARYKPVADQILAVSTRWLTRSQIRQEFQNRKPTIQGIIISEDSKMALLNDRIIKQGESVDDFRVVRVESNKVTFRYKGEEIPLVFRRY